MACKKCRCGAVLPLTTGICPACGAGFAAHTTVDEGDAYTADEKRYGLLQHKKRVKEELSDAESEWLRKRDAAK